MTDIFYVLIMGIVSGLVSGGTIRIQISALKKDVKKLRADVDSLFLRRATDERDL